MKVIVQGQGEVTLAQKDFVAAGGQGQVFTRGGVAYKVYTDPGTMLPVGKITELSVLSDPGLIKPERVLLDPKSNAPVGYTMRFIPDAVPLAKTFTRAFREREGLDHPKMLKLVLRLRELVQHTHDKGVLVVDLNELNYLVSKAFDDVYGIDVDSYQTVGYPASALMLSVRDWSVHGNAWSAGSDWFSFACVAFQMFTGIHPFKGKHPSYVGPDAMVERMKASVSVFDPAVSVPKVVYPFSVIPQGYQDWLRAVLQDRKRLAPPTDPGSFTVLPSVARVVASGAALQIQEVATFRDVLLGLWDHSGGRVAWLPDGVWLNGRPVQSPTHVQAVGFSPKMGRAVTAWTEGGSLRLFDLVSQKDVTVALRADTVTDYDGRIYVKSGDKVVEVVLNDVAGQVIPTPRVAVNVLEHASHLYPGALVQDLLGSAFVSVFPRAGAAFQLRVPEVEAYRIVDAKYDGRVLMVVGATKKGGKYDRLTFVFDEHHVKCSLVSTVHDITPAGLNFTTLDNGVCVHLTEDEKIEAWQVGAPSKVRVVEDKVLGNDMRLVKLGGRVGFVRGDKVFSMRMT